MVLSGRKTTPAKKLFSICISFFRGGGGKKMRWDPQDPDGQPGAGTRARSEGDGNEWDVLRVARNSLRNATKWTNSFSILDDFLDTFPGSRIAVSDIRNDPANGMTRGPDSEMGERGAFGLTQRWPWRSCRPDGTVGAGRLTRNFRKL